MKTPPHKNPKQTSPLMVHWPELGHLTPLNQSLVRVGDLHNCLRPINPGVRSEVCEVKKPLDQNWDSANRKRE